MLIIDPVNNQRLCRDILLVTLYHFVPFLIHFCPICGSVCAGVCCHSQISCMHTVHRLYANFTSAFFFNLNVAAVLQHIVLEVLNFQGFCI